LLVVIASLSGSVGCWGRLAMSSRNWAIDKRLTT
jgi:hypothetical protein